MAEEMHWHDVVQSVNPFVFHIITPNVSGTGFLVSRSAAGDICGIATAAHVVAYAHEWGQLIKIEHFQTGKTLILRPENRVVLINARLDTAAIVFDVGSLELPPNPPALIEEGKKVKVGVEIGWMGFPTVSPNNLCFFSGRISCSLESDSAYLVDGVAINGVSGGPTLWREYDRIRYIGIVSAYMPNRATGESLPGLAVVRDVSHFQEITTRFKSLDDARRNQQTRKPPEKTHNTF